MAAEKFSDRFDDESDVWDNYYGKRPTTVTGLEVMLRTLKTVEFLRGVSKDNLRVLDIGCGTGNVLHAVSRINPKWKLSGIDISKNMIASARKKVPGGTFKQMDILHRKPAGKFDAIIMMGVLPYIKDLNMLVRRLEDITTPGSHVIFTYNNTQSPFLRMREFLAGLTRYRFFRAIIEAYRRVMLGRKEQIKSSSHNLSSFTHRQIINTLSNFKIVKEEGLTYSVGILGPLSVRMNRLNKVLFGARNADSVFIVMKRKSE